jgi:taurine dioxygenase
VIQASLVEVAARPLTPTIGAEVDRVDLTAPMPAGLADALRGLLTVHGVLVFREQRGMTCSQQLALARAFGPVDLGTTPVRIVHDADVPPTENIWHVDHSFRPGPPIGAVLRAIEVPAAGGDTLFADMRAVWRRLPSQVRDLVHDLRATHDIAKWAPEQRVDELHVLAPVVTHPAVRVHPVSGEKILFVDTAYTTAFVGMKASDSVALLDYLLRQTQVPEVQCRVRWEPGSVVVWDNRAVQHYATGDYLPARQGHGPGHARR